MLLLLLFVVVSGVHCLCFFLSMSGAISVDTSYADLVKHVSNSNFTDLINDSSFVDAVMGKEPIEHDDSFYAFVEVLVDMFHDYFRMSSAQRKAISRNIIKGHANLRSFFC